MIVSDQAQKALVLVGVAWHSSVIVPVHVRCTNTHGPFDSLLYVCCFLAEPINDREILHVANQVTDYKDCARLAQHLGVSPHSNAQDWDVVTEILSTDPTLSPQAVTFEIVSAWASAGDDSSTGGEMVKVLGRCFGWEYNYPRACNEDENGDIIPDYGQYLKIS